MLREQYNRMRNVPNISYDAQFLIANESGLFLSTISSFFTNKLNAIKRFFQDETKIFNIKQEPFIEDLLDTYNKNKSKLDKLNFMDIANVEVPWSEMFCKNLYDISLNLNTAFKELDNVIINNLDNTDTLVTKSIANKEFIKSTTPIVSKVNEMEKVLNLCYSSLDKIINTESKYDKVKLKEAIPNMSTISTIIDNLKEIRDMKFYEKASLIEKTIKNIKEKTDNLELILSKSQPNEISKPVISVIAVELETSAKLVSCLGTLLAGTSQAARTLQSIIKEISK